MKFARYLEETQTPEWKKAYIDYRGLKKRITAIRRAQDQLQADPGDTPLLPLSPYPNAGPDTHPPVPERHSEASENTIPSSLPTSAVVEDVLAHEPSEQPPRQSTNTGTSTGVLPRLRRRSTAFSAILRSQVLSPSREHPVQVPVTSHADSVNTSSTQMQGSRRTAKVPWVPGSHPPLRELLPLLMPVQRAFFDMLDGELDKVESFFCSREREVRVRYEALRHQLHELRDHRRAFYEAHPRPSTQCWIPFTFPLTLPSVVRRLHRHAPAPNPVPKPRLPAIRLGKRRRNSSSDSQHEDAEDGGEEEKALGEHDDADAQMEMKVTHAKAGAQRPRVSVETIERAHGEGSSPGVGHSRRSGETTRPRVQVRVNGNGKGRRETARRAGEDEGEGRGAGARRDPEEYHEAKKKLKKAVLECYRGLEVLNNYRTLNLIGFRKALKKFEKVTNIPAQQAYIVEKIEPSAFASGARLDAMLREMEELFAARFVRGDKKKAQARLRGGAQHKSHHFSTFRTGMMIGLAVPALVDGVYKTGDALSDPSWDGLLFVYGIFLVPVVFSFLIGLNLLVWHNARINYIFIFELDLRTLLDHREYFEVPALLLSTLCYAFWLSFSCVSTHSVSPSDWPLLWLAWAMAVWLNPLPILSKSSRYWLVRNIYRQLTSGVRRVEFQDFWMGDQFCSMVFTMSDLWFVGCAYSHKLENWRVCTTGTNWAPMFALAALPFFVRFVQSVRRWVDSRQFTHLINAGKYGTGIIYYMTYYLWRQQGGGHGTRFIAWCILGVFYATYAAAWDILMDWSLMQPHARYPLLRSEVLYMSYIPLYYVAILTNIIIRFEFLMYIPEHGVNYVIRTFIAAMLEMLRRWQWNFFRLENEHIGNMDQYRVTREVPLPYSFDDPSHESDGGEEDEDERISISSKSWRRQKIGTPSTEVVDSSSVTKL